MQVLSGAVICLVCCAVASAQSYRPPAPFASFKTATNSRYPFIIGHRGAPSERPEETLASYQTAISEGADFVEGDTVLTKDCRLILRHEPNLSNTTDADDLFPDRIKNYTIDSLPSYGVHSVDLTLEEVKTLTARERIYRRENSSGIYNDIFRVITPEEYFDLVLNSSRIVGAYLETKHPTWHASVLPQCPNITDLLVEAFQAYGYRGPIGSPEWNAQPGFFESFEQGNLQYAATLTDLPMVQLFDEPQIQVPDLDITYAELMQQIPAVAEYAAGVGPYKENLVEGVGNSGAPAYQFIENAHAAGLQVHPYTYRNDDLPSIYNKNPANEVFYAVEDLDIDGGFTDYPAYWVAQLTGALGATPTPAPYASDPANSVAASTAGRKLLAA